MTRILIVEDLCCRPTASEACCDPVSAGEQLAQFLRARPGSNYEVSVVDAGDAAQSAELPEGLDTAMLPALVIDGRVMHSGSLPNWLDVLGLVERAASTTNRAQASGG